MITKDNFPEVIDPCPPVTPWGYIRQEDGTAVADREQLQCLSNAFDLLENGESYRSVADWIKAEGYVLSKSGLEKLFKSKRPDSPIIQKRAKEQRRKDRLEGQKPNFLSREEKDLKKKKLRIAAEKRRITAAQKRLESLTNQKELKEQIVQEKIELATANVISSRISDEEINELDKKIIFKPNDGPQTEFLAADELEVLYGGAAGGGKSYALIADPMRYFENPNFNGLVLRRTNDELRELIWSSKKLYPEVFSGAKFQEKASEWRFPSGARFWMSYLDRDDDVFRYQGQAFTWIGFDELTQYPSPMPWNYLRSRLRSADPVLTKTLSMRGTTNPGGPGHGWVKRMFVDPATPGNAFWATDIDTNEILRDVETGDPLFKRRFIPAKLSDNPFLWEDGIYRRNLMSLPEKQKAQLLFGDWTMVDGAAFSEFRRSVHVVEPYDIPRDWTRFRSADWGYASASCVLWFAINPDTDQIVVYRELYTNKMTAEQLAFTILQLEEGERIQYGVLDSSVWHKRGEGPSIAEVMISKGCRWRPSDRSQGSRVAGKNRIHELLKINENTGEPDIVFFNNCRNIISDLEVLPVDPNGTDDIDSRYKNDHSYDALRYGVMSRPKSVPWWAESNTYKVVRPADMVFGY